ncbi:hypothetical protein [Streptomyces albipurpureus]|uniref:Uncharacterized protein n=1 Tax=Streptomyces albipurpureus TaxID=2897419 RepID=A0ABT0V4S4_9ACTN|nr:hypothetical protein [Streptomyces sp. CWNU-1]MCM2394376.1 hypothetical protein [Streptomyces sp. CWNU-1]
MLHYASDGREIHHHPRYHLPKLYRYTVADTAPRAFWNRYQNRVSKATIGAGIVIGRYAYCIKWANAETKLH